MSDESKRLAVGLLVLLCLLAALVPTGSEAAEPDAIGIVWAAAQNHATPAEPLLAIVACESRFRPAARGDYGRSHGLVQLNDRATGLIWHFYAQKYTDAYDPEQAADYLARVATGEWARQGVTLWRWSCHR